MRKGTHMKTIGKKMVLVAMLIFFMGSMAIAGEIFVYKRNKKHDGKDHRHGDSTKRTRENCMEVGRWLVQRTWFFILDSWCRHQVEGQ